MSVLAAAGAESVSRNNFLASGQDPELNLCALTDKRQQIPRS